MSEIDLLAELELADDPCPRGCGRSADECEEAEDGGQCAGSPLVQRLERNVTGLLAEIANARQAFDAAIAQRDTEAKARNELEAKLAAAQRELAHYENAINWGTACLNCSRLLDRLYAAEAVVEAAKAWRAQYGQPADSGIRTVDTLHALADAVDALAAESSDERRQLTQPDGSLCGQCDEIPGYCTSGAGCLGRADSREAPTNSQTWEQAAGWRDYSVEPDGTGDDYGAQVICRSDGACEWTHLNKPDRYLTLGEAVDAAQEHARWHAEQDAAASRAGQAGGEVTG